MAADSQSESVEVSGLARRLARGVALLDEAVPGWDSRVDLAYLDAEDPRECVLGQIFDHSEVGMKMLGLGDAAPYGFELSADEDDSSWPTITAAWTALIQSRRTDGKQPGSG